ncbi:unnamed protein product [Aphanomyces euteiches]|uniref:START domain-containing protein n=1 Tax=Aphanomyces euteiches TaxID=100861 RepID=A0A6G0X7H5_9STRA|nr:hypothetical protein Ae201684_007692 [Aphanomyces euteiches]KAH9067294.1 hypothetical protein Ae201684P_021454 [Aphanomyces euteiches]KAH9154075.1 hypothetical protein AeRB84_003773 [Aphanomyces euteiches]
MEQQAKEPIGIRRDGVLQDHLYLVANDHQFREDLAYVYEILRDDSTSSVDEDSRASNGVLSTSFSTGPSYKHATAPATAFPPRQRTTEDPRRFEVRQRQEICLLRHQVEALKAHLEYRHKRALIPPSKWQRVAKIERIEKENILRENARLKQLVHQQATFIVQMENSFRNRPCLSLNDIQSEEWQNYRLPAQKSLRVEAIHAIADRQLRRMQSTFIKAGVFDTTKYILRINFVPQPGGSALVEFVNNIVLAAPFDIMGTIAWELQSCKAPVDLPEGVSQAVEVIDDQTVYVMHEDAPRRSCANSIRKRYVEPYRHVIVQRTVQEDALMPQMNRGAVENKSSWMEITPLPEDATKSHMAFVMHFEMEEVQQNNGPLMKLMASIFDRFTTAYRPAAPGTLPIVTSTMFDTTAVPYLHFQSFAEREKLLVLAMSKHSNIAIQNYLSKTRDTSKALETTNC